MFRFVRCVLISLVTVSALFPILSHALGPARVSESAAQSCSSMLARPAVVVVNAYSSGRFLPKPIRAMGYDVIHISSDAPAILLKSFDKTDVSKDIKYDDDFEKLIQALRNHAPVAVMPGAESGVLLADEIAAALHTEFGIPSNGVLTARRDKYEMNELVKLRGNDTVRQLKTANVEDALKWVRDNHILSGQAVLKPLMSAGSDGLRFCKSEDEIRDAFSKLYGHTNAYNMRNETVLVQERLRGKKNTKNPLDIDYEYVVNTVSSKGKHVVTDIWKYHKKEVEGAGMIYDYDELLPFEGEIQQQLVAYAFRVLDALEIKTGWGHAEIIMTERGPILVEIGNRMMGAGQPRLVQDAIGQSQIELGLEAYLNPEKFIDRPVGYKFRDYAVLMSLSAPVDGFKLSKKIESELAKLPGVVRYKFNYQDGDSIPRTVDMNTSFAQVELVHSDARTIQESVAKIRKLEADGVFFK